MSRVIEFLSYQLEKNTGEAFHDIMVEKSIPLHTQWGISILHSGNSLDDVDAYLLVREYASYDAMEKTLASFYASDAWKLGMRESIVSRIKTSTRIVMDADSQKFIK